MNQQRLKHWFLMWLNQHAAAIGDFRTNDSGLVIAAFDVDRFIACLSQEVIKDEYKSAA